MLNMELRIITILGLVVLTSAGYIRHVPEEEIDPLTHRNPPLVSIDGSTRKRDIHHIEVPAALDISNVFESTATEILSNIVTDLKTLVEGAQTSLQFLRTSTAPASPSATPAADIKSDDNVLTVQSEVTQVLQNLLSILQAISGRSGDSRDYGKTVSTLNITGSAERLRHHMFDLVQLTKAYLGSNDAAVERIREIETKIGSLNTRTLRSLDRLSSPEQSEATSDLSVSVRPSTCTPASSQLAETDQCLRALCEFLRQSQTILHEIAKFMKGVLLFISKAHDFFGRMRNHPLFQLTNAVICSIEGRPVTPKPSPLPVYPRLGRNECKTYSEYDCNCLHHLCQHRYNYFDNLAQSACCRKDATTNAYIHLQTSRCANHTKADCDYLHYLCTKQYAYFEDLAKSGCCKKNGEPMPGVGDLTGFKELQIDAGEQPEGTEPEGTESSTAIAPADTTRSKPLQPGSGHELQLPETGTPSAPSESPSGTVNSEGTDLPTEDQCSAFTQVDYDCLAQFSNKGYQHFESLDRSICYRPEPGQFTPDLCRQYDSIDYQCLNQLHSRGFAFYQQLLQSGCNLRQDGQVPLNIPELERFKALSGSHQDPTSDRPAAEFSPSGEPGVTPAPVIEDVAAERDCSNFDATDSTCLIRFSNAGYQRFEALNRSVCYPWQGDETLAYPECAGYDGIDYICLNRLNSDGFGCFKELMESRCYYDPDNQVNLNSPAWRAFEAGFGGPRPEPTFEEAPVDPNLPGQQGGPYAPASAGRPSDLASAGRPYNPASAGLPYNPASAGRPYNPASADRPYHPTPAGPPAATECNADSPYDCHCLACLRNKGQAYMERLAQSGCCNDQVNLADIAQFRQMDWRQPAAPTNIPPRR